MITVHATMTEGPVELRGKTLNELAKYFDGAHQEFEQAALKVHRRSVFEILILLLRYCNVDTGRLRGSWTPYLDKFGKQSAYARFLNDKSLAKSAPKTLAGKAAHVVGKLFGADAVAQGKREGFFQDSGLVTTVGSNVVYAAKVNQQSQYFDRAAIAGAFIYNQNFENFLKAAHDAGWIPPESDEPKPQ